MENRVFDVWGYGKTLSLASFSPFLSFSLSLSSPPSHSPAILSVISLNFQIASLFMLFYAIKCDVSEDAFCSSKILIWNCLRIRELQQSYSEYHWEIFFSWHVYPWIYFLNMCCHWNKRFYRLYFLGVRKINETTKKESDKTISDLVYI